MLWGFLFAALAATVAAEFFIGESPHEGIAASVGFAAWFGLAACAALIVFANGLGKLLKRPDTYYEEHDD